MDKRSENFELQFEDIMNKRYKMKASPIGISFGLTNLCNISCSFCVYCGFCKKKIERVDMMDLDNIKKIIPYAESAMSVYGSGRGEPLVYDKFKEFMELSDKMGLSGLMQISTNGMLLEKYDAHILENLNMLTISFDSLDRDIFELLRYGAKYDTVKDNIVKIRKELPKNYISLTVTVNRLNIDGIFDLYRFAKENNINAIMFNNVYGEDGDKVIHALRLRKSDYKEFMYQMDKVENDNKDEKIKVFRYVTFDNYEDGELRNKEKIFQDVLALKDTVPVIDFDALDLKNEDCMIHTEYRNEKQTSSIDIPYCMQPFQEFIMHADGRVYGCIGDFASLDCCNDKEVDAIWNGENFVAMREAMFNYDMLPQKCKECRKYARYSNLGDYLEYLCKQGVDMREVKFPPNFFPPAELVNHDIIQKRIDFEYKIMSERNEMKDLKINSREYWNYRFENNWNDFSGAKQTRFFANIACSLMPEWLVNDISEKQYEICDIGCAEGDAIGILRRFFKTEVMGLDFSKAAITNARKKYPGYEFVERNITNLQDDFQTDIVYCSGVLELFKSPWEIFNLLERIAKEYIIILVPYREKLDIREHLYIFDDSNIIIEGDEFGLIYTDTIDGLKIEETYYPGEQILLVYSKDRLRQRKLGDLVKGAVNVAQRECLVQNELIQEKLKKEKGELEQHIETLNNDLARSKENNDEKERINQELRIETDSLRIQYKELEDQYKEQKVKYEEAVKKNEFQENLMFLAKNECFQYNSRTAYKIFRAIYRFQNQFIKGTKEDRKDFWNLLKANILKQRITGTKTDGFNPMYNIINTLDGTEYGRKSSIGMLEEREKKTLGLPDKKLSSKTKEILKKKYEKSDVIILSVINYDFRYQRPQHFAARFAANGHHVFYINANFNGTEQVKEVSDGLFVVDYASRQFNAIYETDWINHISCLTDKLDELISEYAVRDAIVIVDYPNWINGANYLKKKYGYMVITDYMDDFTGFLGTTTNKLKDNCIKLLEDSDLVVASSQFLYDIAVKYAKKVEIVRNGTEVEHFYKSLEIEYHKERKVIGYYGAVAHWFAWEKVCYLAEHLPEYDIVIIGEITEHKEKLQKYSNIKLLGEMPYAKLPEHLAYFDVCLIPFDTSTDLIKATNPVKFYEYLSAGKRVVATEIPELQHFRNEFVYMSNDNEKFLEYVQLCLNGEDRLKSKEECVEFARNNDWQKRFEDFSTFCFDVAPKISIIVLTYNNLELNKACISSIINNTAYPNYELIVVDNQSEDDTVEYLHEVEEWGNDKIKVVYNTQNSGFAGGNNIGIRYASGDYILLLNNDTVVTRGWLTNMVKHLRQNPQYGMCGAVTNSIGNEAQIRVEYKNYNEMTEFAFSYTQLHMGEEYRDVDRLAMFCTLIPREVLDKCGMLDEQYEVGMFEDDDYSQAVKGQKYKLVVAEDAFVHHVNNASFKKLDEKAYSEIFNKNKKIYEDKWNVKWTCPKYREGVDWNNNGKL